MSQENEVNSYFEALGICKKQTGEFNRRQDINVSLEMTNNQS